MVTSMVSGLLRVNNATCAPQLLQKNRTQVELESYAAGLPADQQKASSGTVIQVTTMPPDVRRQIEQWQWAISRKGASSA